VGWPEQVLRYASLFSPSLSLIYFPSLPFTPMYTKYIMCFLYFYLIIHYKKKTHLTLHTSHYTTLLTSPTLIISLTHKTQNSTHSTHSTKHHTQSSHNTRSTHANTHNTHNSQHPQHSHHHLPQPLIYCREEEALGVEEWHWSGEEWSWEWYVILLSFFISLPLFLSYSLPLHFI